MIASREPDIVGKIGKVWDISGSSSDPEKNSLISVHVVEFEAPDGNTMYYNIGLIHLRATPTGIVPEKFYSSAAYEIAVFPVNPNREVDIDKADNADFSGVVVLPAPTIREQFNGLDISDKKAGEITLECIDKLINPPKIRRDQLNPEKDYNENWRKTIQQGVDKRTRKTTFELP